MENTLTMSDLLDEVNTIDANDFYAIEFQNYLTHYSIRCMGNYSEEKRNKYESLGYVFTNTGEWWNAIKNKTRIILTY